MRQGRCSFPPDDSGRVCDRLAGLEQVIDSEAVRQVLLETGRVNQRACKLTIVLLNAGPRAERARKILERAAAEDRGASRWRSTRSRRWKRWTTNHRGCRQAVGKAASFSRSRMAVLSNLLGRVGSRQDRLQTCPTR